MPNQTDSTTCQLRFKRNRQLHILLRAGAQDRIDIDTQHHRPRRECPPIGVLPEEARFHTKLGRQTIQCGYLFGIDEGSVRALRIAVSLHVRKYRACQQGPPAQFRRQVSDHKRPSVGSGIRTVQILPKRRILDEHDTLRAIAVDERKFTQDKISLRFVKIYKSSRAAGTDVGDRYRRTAESTQSHGGDGARQNVRLRCPL
mmetsp:Transcript_2165/g.5296  ORF Transcript_2165/g.5296 Transcript_2165/m.5296 type:complete len:201 (-) Transcript_2165:215-817(-)